LSPPRNKNVPAAAPAFVPFPDEYRDRENWVRYRAAGDPGLREALLARYAYLVPHILGRMNLSLIPGVDRDDLESAGALGLIKALDRFDLGRNVKFETYAYRWVQGSVLDYLRGLDVLSRGARGRVNRLREAHVALRDRLGREPTDEELRKRLGVDAAGLRMAYFDVAHSGRWPLERRVAEGEDEDAAWETLADPRQEDSLKSLEKEEALARLRRSLDALPEKARTALSLYYFDELTFKEIGRILGVTESRVCQLHGKAILELQRRLGKEEEPL
jgi:RNA polymerase sigma factor for flagellar operon FliA